MNTSDYTSKQINRFWSNVNIPDDPDACWEWQASIDKDGYGRFYAGKPFGTHRFLYMISYGEIPDEHHIIHKCGNKRCCNIAHLELFRSRQYTLLPDGSVSIPLTKGMETFVSYDDLDLSDHNWTFCGSSIGYAYRHIKIDGKYINTQLHRVILERMLGRPLQKGEQVDHVDMNGLNNRRDNLRLANPSQNGANKVKYAFNATSIYKGVCWAKHANKWMGYIQFKRRHYNLGYFNTEIEAAQAYNKAAISMFGEFASLNVIKDKSDET